MTRRRIWTLAIVGSIATMITWFSYPALRTMYWRGRGGDMAKARSERRARVQAIWSVVSMHHEKTGTWPSSMEDLRRSNVEQDLDGLLEAPAWSIGDTYEIRFDRLGGDPLSVVVSDPGIDWGGSPARNGKTPPWFNRWRVFLLANGAYTWGFVEEDGTVKMWLSSYENGATVDLKDIEGLPPEMLDPAGRY